MNIRADIAALTAAGRADTDIATELGVHRTTVLRTRRQLRSREGSPLERLLAEDLPTGRVREYGPVPKRQWTEAEQRRHRAELLAGLRETG